MRERDPRVIVALALAIPLAFLAPRAMTVRAQHQSDDPVAVVQASIDAGNDGDSASGAALFADNATYVSSSPTSPCKQQTPCTSRSEILAGLQFNERR